MIQRKKSLRQYSLEKRQREGRPLFDRKQPCTASAGKSAVGRGKTLQGQPQAGKRQRATLKKQSKARDRAMRQYYQDRAEYLQRPDKAACAICLCLGHTPRASTEVHHSRGRIGRLLLDQRFWVPSCRPCRDIPHSRPNWAREIGLLSTATDWNTIPR